MTTPSKIYRDNEGRSLLTKVLIFMTIKIVLLAIISVAVLSWKGLI